MAKGDYVEVLVDSGGGTAREYRIRANRAGGRVAEVKQILTPRTPYIRGEGDDPPLPFEAPSP